MAAEGSKDNQHYNNQSIESKQCCMEKDRCEYCGFDLESGISSFGHLKKITIFY
jgi:hypothetical protein